MSTTDVRPSRAVRPVREGRTSHPFVRYAIRRVITSLLLVVGVTLVTFVLTNLVPGDPVAAALGQRAAEDPAIVARFRAEYGLDKPLVAQYFTYLFNLLHGNLGVSTTTHNPVSSDLAQALPATLEIAIGAIVLSVIIGVVLGTIAAYRRGKVSDHVLRVVSLAGLSVPTFWLALVLYYLFYFKLHIAPGSGRLSSDFNTPPHVTGMYTVDALIAGRWSTFWDALHHLLLPAIVLAAWSMGILTRYTRSAVLEVMGQDYIRSARAKGLSRRSIIFGHILRAALPAIVTVIGIVFANVMSGAVLVENIFSWPGIGEYAYQSSTTLDLPAIAGVSLFIAVVYVVVNFVVDILYGVLDPRVRIQ